MERVLEIIDRGGLINVIVWIVPGFIAWRTYQLRRPTSLQKPGEALLEILVFGVVNGLFWFKSHWTAWPASATEVAHFVLQLFATPIVVALACQSAHDYLASRRAIASPYPRAWDFVFNVLPFKKSGPGANGMFLIVTLKSGDKVAGRYDFPGCASSWPYERDLFIGQAWELVDGKPSRAVSRSIGVYVDEEAIDTIEVLDGQIVVDFAEAQAALEGEFIDG